MPIRGLSNQWKTREGLIERFAHNGHHGKWGKVRQLLESLDARPGPTIYVGTSLSLMNFSNRDVIRYNDRTQPFAYVEVVQSRTKTDEYCYRVETRRIDGLRPTTEWLKEDLTDIETVVDRIREAFFYADVPPRRSQTDHLG